MGHNAKISIFLMNKVIPNFFAIDRFRIDVFYA